MCGMATGEGTKVRRSSSAAVSRTNNPASEPRLPFGKPFKPVIWYRLPRRGVGDVRSPARPNPRVSVEGSHPDAHLGRVLGVAAEEVGATLATEALLKPALR